MKGILKKILSKVRSLVRHGRPSSQLPPVLFMSGTPGGAHLPLASHSGNIGDVIFACAFLKAYWKKTGKKVSLHLQTNVPCVYAVEHPLKNIRMSTMMAEQLRPALLAQPYVAAVTVGPKLPANVDFSLDDFRALPIDYHCHLIQGWYQLCSDLWLDLFEPWISAKQLPEFRDKIVVSRTARLRSDYIDYKFLSWYGDALLFLGLPEECERFKRETGIACSCLTVDSLDKMIDIINSCRLFIGNQGFGYTVAESVKCPRVLESNAIAPNNYPLSPNGRIALFQKQFEAFVHEMAESGRN